MPDKNGQVRFGGSLADCPALCFVELGDELGGAMPGKNGQVKFGGGGVWMVTKLRICGQSEKILVGEV